MKKKHYREKPEESAPIWVKRTHELLDENNMDQTQLAELCGISSSTLSNWIKVNGNTDRSEPKITGFIDLSKALNVSLDYLTGLTNSKSNDEVHKTISAFLGISDNAIDWLHNRKREKRGRERFLSNGTWPHSKEYKQLDLELFNYIFTKNDFLKSFDTALFQYINLLIKCGYPNDRISPEIINDINYARYNVMRTIETLLDDMYHDLYEQYKIKTN